MNLSKYLCLSIALALVLTILCGIFNACDNCIKSCGVFTPHPVTECSARCGLCRVLDNRFTNWLNWYHVDNYSYLKTDEKMCYNNYAPTPNLETNDKNIKTKPNIVLIVLDDLDEFSPYWSAMKFARRLFKVNGTHFSNAHTSTSFCCPARCQIFTGMYGHNNGVMSSYGTYGTVNAYRKPYNLNGTRMTENGKCINNEFRSLPVYLKKYGKYKTGIFGKYLNGFESDTFSTINYVPAGWDQFDITTNNFQYAGHMYTMTEWDSDTMSVKYKWYGKEPKNYLTDVISEKAEKFINKHSEKDDKKSTNPMFLYVAPTAPHFPQTGAHRHLKYLKYWESQFVKHVESRPNFHSNQSVNSKSSWLKSNSLERDQLLNMKTNNWYSKSTINIHKLEFAKRMTTLYAVDEMILNIYNTLKNQKKLDNTIFILVSDNGFNMGSHKLYHKMVPYEESIRIPFYMSGSGIKKGWVDNRLVLLNDLAPTILNLAGFKTPAHMDGIDLESTQSRNSILIEYGKFAKNKNEDFTGNLNRVGEFQMAAKLTPYYMAFDVPPYTAIKTSRHLYVEYYDSYNQNNTEYELYDMSNDPYQITNIYNQTLKNNITLIQQLQVELKQLETCYGSECINQV